MPCYKPIEGWHHKEGGFTQNYANSNTVPLTIPCNVCIGCRIDNSKEKAIRCMHEASLYEENTYLTLTYNDESLPENGNLNHEDFQKFMKRLRVKNNGKKIRFFMCGEYGDSTLRAHYHAILFNFKARDEEAYKINKQGQTLYKSDYLTRTWKNGFAVTGEVSWESCAYVARYVMKKQNDNKNINFVSKYGQPICDENGELIGYHPTVKEYSKQSTVPGIGYDWYKKYRFTDCFNQGFVLDHKCRKQKIPRFYWDKLQEEEPELYKKYRRLYNRRLDLEKLESDNSYKRQDVKERCLIRKTQILERKEI